MALELATNGTDPGLFAEEQKQKVPEKQRIAGGDFGDWEITQKNHFQVLADYDSDVVIQFIPNKEKVNSTEIAFVQIFKISDSKTGAIMTALGPKGSGGRMTRSGWAVDRQPNKYAWFGYADNGKPAPVIKGLGINEDIDVVGVVPGSSPNPFKPAVLHVVPQNPKGNVYTNTIDWFETYAIAKSGIDEGTIYGGLKWGFTLDALAKVTSLKRQSIDDPSAISGGRRHVE